MYDLVHPDTVWPQEVVRILRKTARVYKADACDHGAIWDDIATILKEAATRCELCIKARQG